MDLRPDQVQRLNALSQRRARSAASAAEVVLLDVRSSEGARLAVSAVALLAVGAGIVGLRSLDRPPTSTRAAARTVAPRPTIVFELPATAATDPPVTTAALAEPSRSDQGIEAPRPAIDTVTQGT